MYDIKDLYFMERKRRKSTVKASVWLRAQETKISSTQTDLTYYDQLIGGVYFLT